VVVVLAGASGQELVGAGDTREVAGAARTLHGEAGSFMRCGSMGDLTISSYAINEVREEVFIMPGMDGTGPMGAGPMTGGGWGLCNPSGTAYAGPIYGRGRGFRGGFGPGFGWGRGYGRGFGRGFGWRGAYPPIGGWYGPTYNAPYGTPYTMAPEDEVNMLKGEADAVKRELDAINKRIEELKTEPAES
jgi:hypothetical protein